MGDSHLKREALRINERYLTEVVECFDLCPWAKSTRSTEKLHRAVYLGGVEEPGVLTEISKDIERFSEAQEWEIGLLIFPNHKEGSAAFRAFVGSLEKAHADQHPRHDIPLAMASFHPDAEADLSSPARLVSFIRRSPDPTIQLVRRESMAKVRQGPSGGSTFAESLESFLPLMGQKAKLSVSDNIAKTNLETVQGVGVERLEAIFQDIARDRDQSYRQARLQDGAKQLS